MTDAAATAEPPPTAKRLVRTKHDRLIAGVCAGIARYFAIDPVLVRVAAVVLVFFGGVGILVYLAAILLVPAEDEVEPLLHPGAPREDRLVAIAGIVLLGIGVCVLADRIGFTAHATGPVVLLALGGALLYRWFDRRDAVPATPPATSPATPPAAPHATPPVASPAAPPSTDPGADPDTAQTAVMDAATAPTARHDVPTAPAGRRRHAVRDGLLIAGGTLAVCAAGVAAVGALAGDDVDWVVVLIGVAIALGAALVAASFWGGAALLIAPAIVVVAAAAIAVGTGLQLRGGWGDPMRAPIDAATLQPHYELAGGRLELDLRDLRLPPGTTHVTADVGIGQLLIVAPPTVAVELRAHTGLGAITAGGDTTGGSDVRQTVTLDPRPSSGSRRGGPARLIIDGHVGIGEVEIVRPGQQGDPGRRAREHVHVGERHGPPAIGLAALVLR